jgi:hypothetical protein
MAILDTEIATFDTLRPNLEAEHMGEWVLLHGQALIGIFAGFDEAAQVAVTRFGRGPYLIRQIGAPALILLPSVMYRPIYG